MFKEVKSKSEQNVLKSNSDLSILASVQNGAEERWNLHLIILVLGKGKID